MCFSSPKTPDSMAEESIPHGCVPLYFQSVVLDLLPRLGNSSKFTGISNKFGGMGALSGAEASECDKFGGGQGITYLQLCKRAEFRFRFLKVQQVLQINEGK